MRYASVVALVIGSVGALAAPRVADACGGCFGPVDTPQVVTDHRMVMAVHARESILWDQIRYTGRPEDFSWVLPVQGDVRVELASGLFFDTLDQTTQVQVRAPQINFGCPGRFASDSNGPSAGAADAGASEMGVTIIREEVVGPYQTVTLRSTNPGALTTWLRSNNYVIPPSIEPIISWYVERRMDFVALRLRPGEGVQSMQPIRIRYATANMVLPLRMVAAGVGDKVGIALWVFGNGRHEAANFANGVVEASRLTWNWTTNRSNYTEVWNETLRGLSGGRAWITEFAQPQQNIGWRFENSFQPGSDELRADWNLATNNDAPGVWVTRLRTDLITRFLDTDLSLQASASTNFVSNILQVPTGNEVGARPGPNCPPPFGRAMPVGSGGAVAPSDPNGGGSGRAEVVPGVGGGCSTSHGGGGSAVVLALGALAAGVAASRRRRG